MDYLVVIFRTFFFYVLITMIYRIMGKREIGQLGIVDLIVSILIAELAAISIDNHSESIWLSIIPILLLTVIQIIIAYFSMHHATFRNVLDGEASIIINNGKVNFKEMEHQRYNIEDLLVQLRGQHIKSIEEVEYAILETSGRLSVFRKDSKNSGSYPMPIILEGKIMNDSLKAINKDLDYILLELKKRHISLKDVFYAFYLKNKLFVIKKH